MNPLDSFQIVLVEPQNPINVGTVVRAMKNMGLRQLTLVHPAPMDLEKTQISAHHTEDMIASIRICETLDEALEGVHESFGFSARRRTQTWASLDMENAVSRSLVLARESRRIAFVFGREQTGLTNTELERCSCQVHIDTADYSSLNLAQAVLLACYTLRRQNTETPRHDAPKLDNFARDSRPATLDERMRLLRTLEDTLVSIGYYKSQDPNTAIHRVQNLLNRADLHDDEYHLLMGMIREVGTYTKMLQRGCPPKCIRPRNALHED